MAKARAKVSPSAELVALLGALNGAALYGIEQGCVDWLGELDGAAATAGYHLQLPDDEPLDLWVLGELNSGLPLQLSPSAPEPTPEYLFTRGVGLRQSEPARATMQLTGESAELARLAATSLTMLKGRQLTSPQGLAMRLELSADDTTAAMYVATTTGARLFATWPIADLDEAQQTWLDQVQSVVDDGAISKDLAVDATEW